MAALKKLMCVLSLSVVVGCTSLTTEPQTIGQRYFAAKQDYKTLLTSAVIYKDECYANPTYACEQVVEELRSADTRLQALIEASDAVLTAEDKTELSNYVLAMSVILAEVQALLTKRLEDIAHETE